MGGFQEFKGTDKEWMTKELRRLFFTLKPWQAAHPELFESYTAALGEVAPVEMTALVNKAVKTHWPDLNWCSPKELSDLLTEMRMIARAETIRPLRDDCENCRGGGYVPVHKDGSPSQWGQPDTYATPCKCRSREKEKAAKAG